MKVAYLLAPYRAKMQIPGTRRVYEFTPWADVDPQDWPLLQSKKYMAGCSCRNRNGRQEIRVFGSEEEISTGVLGFHR